MKGEIRTYEIPADDIDEARRFWGSLFGWTFESVPGPVEYHAGRVTDRFGPAITNMEPGKLGARVYFDVDDIRAEGDRVVELGGQAGDPIPVPGMGWARVCRDPHGNDFGLWQDDATAPVPNP